MFEVSLFISSHIALVTVFKVHVVKVIIYFLIPKYAPKVVLLCLMKLKIYLLTSFQQVLITCYSAMGITYFNSLIPVCAIESVRWYGHFRLSILAPNSVWCGPTEVCIPYLFYFWWVSFLFRLIPFDLNFHHNPFSSDVHASYDSAITYVSPFIGTWYKLIDYLVHLLQQLQYRF